MGNNNEKQMFLELLRKLSVEQQREFLYMIMGAAVVAGAKS